MEEVLSAFLRLTTQATFLLIRGGIGLIVAVYGLIQGHNPRKPDDLVSYRQSQIESMVESAEDKRRKSISGQQKAIRNISQAKRGRK
jgi:hypothetical protein